MNLLKNKYYIQFYDYDYNLEEIELSYSSFVWKNILECFNCYGEPFKIIVYAGHIKIDFIGDTIFFIPLYLSNFNKLKEIVKENVTS